MFAGHIENLLGFYGLHQLVNRVEFIRAGKMGEIARVQDKIRRHGSALMRAIACLNVPTTSVLIASLLKPMCESLIWTKLKLPFDIMLSVSAAPARRGNSVEPSKPPADGPKHSGAGPGHAFQKTAAVKAVVFSVRAEMSFSLVSWLFNRCIS